MAKNKQLSIWLEFLLIIIIFAIPVRYIVPWQEIMQISDFIEFYAASALIHNGQYNQIYNTQLVQSMEHILLPASTHAYLPFLISPILSWIFYPLACFNINVSLYLWMAFLWLLIIVSYLILCHKHNITGTKKVWWAAFIALSGPYIEAIRLGQLSPILLLGLTILYIGMKKRQLVIPTIGQSLLWLKPHLLMPLLFFEMAGSKAKLAMLTGILGLAGLLFSCLFAGFTIMPNYIHLLAQDEVYGNALGLLYSPTLRGQLLKFSLDQITAVKVATAVYCLFLLFCFFINKCTKHLNDNTNLLFTTIVPFMLCLVPHLHNYDLLLLLPGIFLLNSYNLTGTLKNLRLLVIILMVLVSLLPNYVVLHYFYVCRGGLINPFFWTTLILAVSASFIEINRENVQ